MRLCLALLQHAITTVLKHRYILIYAPCHDRRVHVLRCERMLNVQCPGPSTAEGTFNHTHRWNAGLIRSAAQLRKALYHESLGGGPKALSALMGSYQGAIAIAPRLSGARSVWMV